MIANAGVLGAGGSVYLSGSAWPDIIVGLTIAALFAASAVGIIQQALQARRPLLTPHKKSP